MTGQPQPVAAYRSNTEGEGAPENWVTIGPRPAITSGGSTMNAVGGATQFIMAGSSNVYGGMQDADGSRDLAGGTNGTDYTTYATPGAGNDFNLLGSPDFLNYSTTAIDNTSWGSPSFYSDNNGPQISTTANSNYPTIAEIEFALKANMSNRPKTSHIYFFRICSFGTNGNNIGYSSPNGDSHMNDGFPSNNSEFWYPGATIPTWNGKTYDNQYPIPYSGSGNPSDYDNDYRASAMMPYLYMATTPLSVNYAQELLVTVKNNVVCLAWATAAEVNNKHFVIQRSNDGVTFTQIGVVPGKATNGNSSATLSYAYTDENPLAGVNHYRLQQVDMGGNTEHSKIVSVTTGSGASVSLYPNPATTVINVQNIPIGSSVVIYNTAGNTVYTGTVTASRFSVNVQRFSAGVYFLQYKTNGVNNTIKFIKH
jgi:hypothetical protein